MFSKVYIPQYPLSQFIVSFWYGEHAPQHAFERLLPNGDIDLVMNLCDAKLRFYGHGDLHHLECFTGPIVSGAHSDYYVIDTFQQTSLLGVKFRPGGAYPFLGDSADRLQNRRVALEDLWGPSALELQTRLMEAQTPAARFHCLEQALLVRLSNTIRPHPVVAHAVSTFLRQRGCSSIATVVGKTGLSSRRFIELFSREVGLSPKTFCRVRRFHHVLQRLPAGGSFDLATLALACGYYDQSHLIRDFKAFTGLTPTAYLAVPGAYGNQVPLAERGQIYPIHSETPLLYS